MNALILTTLALVILGSFALIGRATAKHHRNLATQARDLRLSYRPVDALHLVRRYRCLMILREGHDRRTWDVLSGPTSAGSLTCFTFRYEVGLGINREVRYWRVAVLDTRHQFGCWALRYSAEPEADSSIWADPCDSALPPEAPSDQWRLFSRSATPPGNFDARVYELLGKLQSECMLEFCGSMAALMVPLDDTTRQLEAIVPALIEVADCAVGGESEKQVQRGRHV